MVRGPYAGSATRAGRDPARNLNEWPPGLARRGPQPGEVGKASSVGDYLTYWLNGVAVHRLRENTHTRYAACVRLHLIPGLGLGLGTKKIARLTAKDVRTFLDRLRTTCRCCAQGLDNERKKCCAIGECCQKRLSPLTVTLRALGAQVRP